MLRPRLLAAALFSASLALAGCADRGGGAGFAGDAPKSLTVVSSAFEEGAPIPLSHVCTRDGGRNVSPPLTVGGLPPASRSFALLMDDPDAPRGTFLHWTAWNLPPADFNLLEAVDVGARGGREGANGAGRPGYTGPCPPAGPAHHYHFKAYAVDAVLDLPAGAALADVEAALSGHVLAWGELVGTHAQP